MKNMPIERPPAVSIILGFLISVAIMILLFAAFCIAWNWGAANYSVNATSHAETIRQVLEALGFPFTMVVTTAWLFSRGAKIGWWLALICIGVIGFWLASIPLAIMQTNAAHISVLLSVAAVIVCLFSRSSLHNFKIIRRATSQSRDAS